MLKIANLPLGFTDAENYKRRENKTLFNHIFIKTSSLDKICQPSTTFLIGEKGTGKTAYSVYMANTQYKNNACTIRYIRETEYQKFITLKKEKHLDLSDYANIWKVIIYLLISQQIIEKEKSNFLNKRFPKFKALNDAIQEYYLHAFSPEIIHALQFVQESKLAAELLSKYAKAIGEEKDTLTFSESRFQTNLLYIQKNFESALKSLKLDKSHILFIDGIDIRPSTVPYSEYLECIKGLANAVWEVNNDFFPSVRDSKGRMRAVLLLRPDIFESLSLQNQNTKTRDNSVLLDWRTDYRDHRTSDLFKLTDHLLANKQKQQLETGHYWDYYFPFDTPNVDRNFDHPTAFISFLRFAYYRPRDIVTMLSILKENFIETNQKSGRVFTIEDFKSSRFRRKYSNYLLGEVKDQLSFYYSKSDYELFLKFFEFLNGNYRFSYSDYISYYDNYVKYLDSTKKDRPRFVSTANDFLQFLYDLNIICYVEKADDGSSFIHWCFRDRSYSNISPKIKTERDYEIFYGIGKALNVGKSLAKK